MKNILSFFGLMFLLTLSMGSISQSGECDELKKENEQLRKKLTETEMFAKASNMEAMRQQKISSEASKQADAANAEAQRQAIRAQEMLGKAQQEAERQAVMAIKNAAEAERQKKIAEECARKKN